MSIIDRIRDAPNRVLDEIGPDEFIRIQNLHKIEMRDFIDRDISSLYYHDKLRYRFMYKIGDIYTYDRLRSATYQILKMSPAEFHQVKQLFRDNVETFERYMRWLIDNFIVPIDLLTAVYCRFELLQIRNKYKGRFLPLGELKKNIDAINQHLIDTCCKVPNIPNNRRP